MLQEGDPEFRGTWNRALGTCIKQSRALVKLVAGPCVPVCAPVHCTPIRRSWRQLLLLLLAGSLSPAAYAFPRGPRPPAAPPWCTWVSPIFLTPAHQDKAAMLVSEPLVPARGNWLWAQPAWAQSQLRHLLALRCGKKPHLSEPHYLLSIKRAQS